MRFFRRAMAFAVLSLMARTVLASPEAASPGTSPAAATPPRIEQARLLAALRSKIPIEPVALQGDPYLTRQAGSQPRAAAGTVCGVQFESDRVHYRISTFADAPAARTSG